MITVPLWTSRLFGMRLLNLERAFSEDFSQRNRFQFSIRCLLEWITIAAVFMASLTYIFGKGETFVLHRDWEQIIVIAACNALLALSLTWAVLSVEKGNLRIIQAVFTFIFVHVLLFYFVNVEASDIFSFPLAVAVILPSLWFFRGIGYRLTWHRKPSQKMTAK
jgi:hypothetical protein